MTGLLCNPASAPDQVGHFRNQGMSVSQKKNPQMIETNEKDKIGHTHTHTHADRILESAKPWCKNDADENLPIRNLWNQRNSNKSPMSGEILRGYRWQEPQERLHSEESMCASLDGWVGIGQAEGWRHGLCRQRRQWASRSCHAPAWNTLTASQPTENKI